MNKYQEALDTLVKYAHESPNLKWVLIHEENIIQELVDKATGQKKHIENCEDREYLNHNYCYACGQKLDWNEDDDL